MGARLVISADFHPDKDKWTGFAVIMGVKGTHENYNVIYNGICDNRYFDSEEEAKRDIERYMVVENVLTNNDKDGSSENQ
jgi:hypothetical protein